MTTRRPGAGMVLEAGSEVQVVEIMKVVTEEAGRRSLVVEQLKAWYHSSSVGRERREDRSKVTDMGTAVGTSGMVHTDPGNREH